MHLFRKNASMALHFAHTWCSMIAIQRRFYFNRIFVRIFPSEYSLCMQIVFWVLCDFIRTHFILIFSSSTFHFASYSASVCAAEKKIYIKFSRANKRWKLLHFFSFFFISFSTFSHLYLFEKYWVSWNPFRLAHRFPYKNFSIPFVYCARPWMLQTHTHTYNCGRSLRNENICLHTMKKNWNWIDFALLQKNRMNAAAVKLR